MSAYRNQYIDINKWTRPGIKNNGISVLRRERLAKISIMIGSRRAGVCRVMYSQFLHAVVFDSRPRPFITA